MISTPHPTSTRARKRLATTSVTLLLGFLLFGCGGSDRAVVEELLDSGPAPLPLELDSVTGGRDGALTRAEFVFGGEGSELRLELKVHYDPRPVLSDGSWSYRGPTGTAEGRVEAESVRFVGGQGEGASVGGVYLLQEDGDSRFRVHLPLVAVSTGGWNPEAD